MAARATTIVTISDADARYLEVHGGIGTDKLAVQR